MESAVLAGIGIMAAGYIAYTVWRSLSGKQACSCGCSGCSRDSGGGCPLSQGRPPQHPPK